MPIDKTIKLLSQNLNQGVYSMFSETMIILGIASGVLALGFSAFLASKVMKSPDGNEKMIEKAKENIKLAGFEKNITILEGDAEEILKEVEGPFDMIFMDAAKGQYKLFYDMIIDKLRVDGLLISDNILYKGMVAHDDFVIRRKKTIVKRMRNYLDYICNCDYLSTSLIPIGDGVALSYKNNKRGDINV